VTASVFRPELPIKLGIYELTMAGRRRWLASLATSQTPWSCRSSGSGFVLPHGRCLPCGQPFGGRRAGSLNYCAGNEELERDVSAFELWSVQPSDDERTKYELVTVTDGPSVREMLPPCPSD
jgi:hypothetical protein